MASISDLIENFILSALGDGDSLEISRNSLAQHFACAPSQVNYVLSTRFTLERGYTTNSKRGGGGYVLIQKLTTANDGTLINFLNENIGNDISYARAEHIADRLEGEKVINAPEKSIILSALSDRALAMPLLLKDKLRAQILKNILIDLYTESDDNAR